MSKNWYLAAAVAVMAGAMACGEKSSSPAAPSTSQGAVDTAGANADGSNLKVPAPTPTAPANGATLEEFSTVLKVNGVTGLYVNTTQFAYKFQLLINGQVVREFRTSSTTEWHVGNLSLNSTYSWRARAEQGPYFGPWSAPWSFKTPDIPEGYIAGGEVYDPLWTGTSVGRVVGSVTFLPDVGAKMNGHTSHIEYALPETVAAGEFSMLVSGVSTNTEGGKTKIMAMCEGPCVGDEANITVNDRRFTIEKRGDPAGVIAWRVITSNDQIETTGTRERVEREFNPNKWYLWKATWGGGRFDLQIWEDGAGGKQIYSFGKNYRGTYDPKPHLAFVGTRLGRAGASDATVPGMIAKQVWLSARPRPEFANQ